MPEYHHDESEGSIVSTADAVAAQEIDSAAIMLYVHAGKLETQAASSAAAGDLDGEAGLRTAADRVRVAAQALNADAARLAAG